MHPKYRRPTIETFSERWERERPCREAQDEAFKTERDRLFERHPEITYLQDLATEFTKVADLEGNDWMLFIYETTPPWFITDVLPVSNRLFSDQARRMDNLGHFIEAAAMLNTAVHSIRTLLIQQARRKTDDTFKCICPPPATT